MSRPEYDRDAGRLFTGYAYRSRMGRSSFMVDCPFCKTSFVAYAWSIAGGGKKCPGCGAIHGGYGMAFPVKQRSPA